MKKPCVLEATGSSILMLAFTILTAAPATVAAGNTFTWVGTYSSSWGDSRNWSPGGVPGNGDSIILNSGGVNAEGRNLTLVAATLNGGSLYGLGTLHVGSLALSGAALTAASVVLDGNSTWAGGAFYTPVLVPTGVTVTISAGVTRLGEDVQLTNQGTVRMTGGRIEGYWKSVIQNEGTWELQGHEQPFTSYYGDNVFRNSGLLNKTGGADPTMLNAVWTYQLNAETRCDAGELRFGSTTVLPAGARLKGNGTIRFLSTTQLDGSVSETIARLILDGGTLVCAAGGEIQGSLEWASGYIQGSLTIPSGASLVATGNGFRRINESATIDNYGTLRWQATSPIEAYWKNTVRNHPSGLVDLAADGDPFKNYYTENLLHNEGIIRKSAGTGDLVINEWSLRNDGMLEVQSGAVECQAYTELRGGSSISGSGELRFNGDIRLSGTVTESIASLRMTGGGLNGTAPCMISGSLTWEAGTVSGTLDVPAGSTLQVQGAAAKQLAHSAVLNIAGTCRWSGPAAVQGYENCRINILAGGVFDLAADGDPLNNYYGGNELINAGLMVKSGGAGGSTVCNDWTYRQRGELRCEASTLEFASTLVFENSSTVTGAGAVLIYSSTQLPGAVTFSAPTTWSGGTWTGSGGSIAGTLVWSGGNSAGPWQVAAAGTLQVIDGAGTLKQVNNSSEIGVAGLLKISSGTVRGYDEFSRIRILNGGRLRAAGAALMNEYYDGGRIVVEAGGTIDSLAGADLRIDWAVDNHGSVAISQGLVKCNGGGASNGSFQASGSGALHFTAGVQSLSAGAVVTGPGEVVLSGGTLEALAGVNCLVHVAGGNAQGTLPNGEFRFTDGSKWTGGTLSGTCRVANGATLAVSSADFKRMNPAATLAIGGRLLWQGDGPIQFYQDCAVTVDTSGVFEMSGAGAPFSLNYGGNSLTNHGTIRRSTSAGDVTLHSASYASDGVISAQTGRLLVSAPLQLGPGGSVTGGARLVLAGNRTTLVGTTQINSAVVELAGAELFAEAANNGRFTGSTFEWRSGSITGQVTLAGVAATTGDGFRRINDSAELRNAGVLTLGGTGVIESYQNSTLRNLAGAIMHASSGITLTYYYGGNQFSNEGTLTIGSSPGRMTVNIPFVQTSTGRLEVGVAGADQAIPQFDILKVNSSATLAGTLVAYPESGYQAPVGTTYEILKAQTRIGTFGTVVSVCFDATYPATGTPPVSLNNVVLVAKEASSGLDFNTWAEMNDLHGADASCSADKDRDGCCNMVEYALNMDPRAADMPPMQCTRETIGGVSWLMIRYRRWDDRISAGLNYEGEWSENLSTWSKVGIIDETDTAAPLVAGSAARICLIQADVPKKFLRLGFR
jgi:hypothetical protein